MQQILSLDDYNVIVLQQERGTMKYKSGISYGIELV